MVKLDSLTHSLCVWKVLGWRLFLFHPLGLDGGDQLVHFSGEVLGDFGEVASIMVMLGASRAGGAVTITPLGSGAG